MSPPQPDDYASQSPADFIFEARPDPDVFDDVRRAVTVRIEEDHSKVFPMDIRTHLRIDTIDVDPSTWHVGGILNGGHDVDFEIAIRADTDATQALIEYLRLEVDRRFGGYVDPDAVAFEKIGMRPNAWFVDGKIPQSKCGGGNDAED